MKWSQSLTLTIVASVVVCSSAGTRSLLTDFDVNFSTTYSPDPAYNGYCPAGLNAVCPGLLTKPESCADVGPGCAAVGTTDDIHAAKCCCCPPSGSPPVQPPATTSPPPPTAVPPTASPPPPTPVAPPPTVTASPPPPTPVTPAPVTAPAPGPGTCPPGLTLSLPLGSVSADLLGNPLIASSGGVCPANSIVTQIQLLQTLGLGTTATGVPSVCGLILTCSTGTTVNVGSAASATCALSNTVQSTLGFATGSGVNLGGVTLSGLPVSVIAQLALSSLQNPAQIAIAGSTGNFLPGLTPTTFSIAPGTTGLVINGATGLSLAGDVLSLNLLYVCVNLNVPFAING